MWQGGHVAGEPALAPGDVAGDRFRVVRRIGSGATSTVFEAVDLSSDARVALKVLRGIFLDEGVARRRFAREAEIVGALVHPSIPRLLHAGFAPNGQPYLAMELLDGETLEARITGRLSLTPPSPMAARDVITFGRDLLDALAVAHAESVVHRDLKPANVFLTRDADRERARLLDFGVSRVLADDGPRLTAPSTLVGTLAYLAPEQLLPGHDPDARADLYGLAVVLFRALTNELPYTAKSTRLIRAIREETPRAPSSILASLAPFDALFARALAKEPDARFQSAAEMRAALSAVGANSAT